MKKRFISMLLSLCMMLSICTFVPLNVSAETSGTCGENLTWVLDDEGTLTISGKGTMLDWSFSSPAPWDDVRERISNVVIGNGISNIGSSAFANCSSLLDIEIAESVTSIGENAFGNCSSLISIVIPDSVVTMGDGIFYQATSLEQVALSKNINRIGEWVFGSCFRLKNITIPDGVTTIDYRAFIRCYDMDSINIPSSVTSIGEGAFLDCNNLTNVYYAGLETQWNNIDISSDNTAITSANITFDNSTETIGTFEYTVNDGKVTITGTGSATIINGTCTIPSTIDGYTVTSINERAFNGFDSFAIRNVFIPSTITSIDTRIFNNCFHLENINVNINNSEYSSVNGVLFNKDQTVLIRYPVDKPYSSSNIPNSVKVIGENSFYQCYYVSHISIQESVTSIGENAFMMSYLKSVSIPESVTSIGKGAFASSEITSISIPESVVSIGEGAFAACGYLTTINVDANNTEYSSFDGVLFNKNQTTLIAYPKGNTQIYYNVPNGVKTIENYAFSNSYSVVSSMMEGSLSDIILPDGLNDIGEYAFSGCRKLKKVTLPNSVSNIGISAFSECISLESIIIPSNMTAISENTFSYCTSLSNIVLPISITSVDRSAFYPCEQLTDVYYTGTQEQWGNIEIYGYNDIRQANVHYNYIIPEQTYELPIISAPTNSYAGTYYTFEATFDTMPTSAFLQFDSPADGWTWFSDEYCSTNPVFNIPTDEIVEKDERYVYQTSFVIYSSGNVSDSYNRQVRVAADINGTRHYSEGAKFVVQPTPARPKNTIGYLYEQTSNPSGDTIAPEIKGVEVTKTNGKYRLTIKDITAENEDWVFFYWQTDNGEFEKVTDDFKTVDLTVSGDANVTVTMGDGCGYITTKTIEIN